MRTGSYGWENTTPQCRVLVGKQRIYDGGLRNVWLQRGRGGGGRECNKECVPWLLGDESYPQAGVTGRGINTVSGPKIAGVITSMRQGQSRWLIATLRGEPPDASMRVSASPSHRAPSPWSFHLSPRSRLLAGHRQMPAAFLNAPIQYLKREPFTSLQLPHCINHILLHRHKPISLIPTGHSVTDEISK